MEPDDMAKQAQKTEVATREDRAPVVNAEALKAFRHELGNMEAQFAPMLPAHIPPERFARVVMNAINRTPRLMACNRRSLWNACMQSAEDGLLPDGREGAIVPFKDNKAGQLLAQWIPMVGGIRKKVRNSGLLSDFNVQVVYPEDDFAFELGDAPFIRHKPAGVARSNKIAWVYSIATFKDGTKSREVMSAEQVAQVAGKSKSRDSGPWSDPVFFQEMAKKTCAKLHAKQLPSDRDLDRVLRRDDSLYEFDRAAIDAKHERPTIPGGTKAALEHFATAKAEPPHTASDSAADSVPEDRDGAAGADGAATDGEPAKEEGHNSAPPETPDEYAAHFEAWLAKVPSGDAARKRWKDEQDLRLSLEPKVDADRLKAWKAALDGKFASAEQ